jgi:hypothetical protein
MNPHKRTRVFPCALRSGDLLRVWADEEPDFVFLTAEDRDIEGKNVSATVVLSVRQTRALIADLQKRVDGLSSKNRRRR